MKITKVFVSNAYNNGVDIFIINDDIRFDFLYDKQRNIVGLIKYEKIPNKKYENFVLYPINKVFSIEGIDIENEEDRPVFFPM